MRDINHIINVWRNSNKFDKNTKENIKAMNLNELKLAFDSELEFGTAGLRGILGLGTNRMNKYTVFRAAEAMSLWIKQKYNNPKVIVGNDIRYGSEEFRNILISVFNKYSINVIAFDIPINTPELSYSIKKTNSNAGFMITASHNPKNYNGIKVFKETSSQILQDDADIIKNFMDNLDYKDLEYKISDNLVFENGEYLLSNYINDVIDLSLYKNVDPKNKLLYTPFNGCALRPIKAILDKKGYSYTVYREHKDFDPDFTTIPYPNPEVMDNFDDIVEYAKENNYNIIIANDPDGDRMNALIKNGNQFKLLGGNILGALFIKYIIDRRNDLNLHPGVIVKTIVTDDFGKTIAQKNGYKVLETLTGFKNISNVAINLKDDEFIFGYEESIGYEIGDLVRDKDGISACMFFADMVEYYSSKNVTIADLLSTLYNEYGYFEENNFSIPFEGVNPVDKMKLFMHELRSFIPNEINGLKLIKCIDYLKTDDESLKTDALQLYLEDETKISLRPSGTEPKLKIYIHSHNNNKDLAIENINKVTQWITERIDKINE